MPQPVVLAPLHEEKAAPQFTGWRFKNCTPTCAGDFPTPFHELCFELLDIPAGVAEQETDRRPGVVQLGEGFDIAAKLHARKDRSRARRALRPRVKNMKAINADRSSAINRCSRPGERASVLDDPVESETSSAIQNQTDRTQRTMFAQEYDRAREVRVVQPGTCDEDVAG